MTSSQVMQCSFNSNEGRQCVHREVFHASSPLGHAAMHCCQAVAALVGLNVRKGRAFLSQHHSCRYFTS